MILDADGNPLSIINDILADNGATKTYRIQPDCLAGHKLWAEPSDDVTIEAQLVGDISWTSLVYPGIDLTPYDGTRQLFDVRFTSADITGVVREVSEVWVSP